MTIYNNNNLSIYTNNQTMRGVDAISRHENTAQRGASPFRKKGDGLIGFN